MRYRITASKIQEVISKTYFANDGDPYERRFWPFLKERFPNCETFWRHLVVPNTKRIQLEVKDPSERIRPREGVCEDITDIASVHYSMFLNLIYSYDHLQNFRLSSFEDFYIHLVSACDLAEEFLQDTRSLTLECAHEESEVPQKLGKEEFLKLAGEWYDDKYAKVYEHYVRKGKAARVTLPGRKNLLGQYFGHSENWKEYRRCSRGMREYRNVIVHDVQIGRIATIGGVTLVPKKEKIQSYKRWSDVFAARADGERLRDDFINMTEQMILDIGRLEVTLNKLWEKPLEDLKKLFFQDRNEILLTKYNIELT
ncbi:MAG: hypothetical protein Q8Q12_19725 [bacterium]|nr:hypothetical protein [bacterium]